MWLFFEYKKRKKVSFNNGCKVRTLIQISKKKIVLLEYFVSHLTITNFVDQAIKNRKFNFVEKRILSIICGKSANFVYLEGINFCIF